MTSAAAVLARAVRGGLVDAGDTLAGRVTVRSVGASNAVYRLDAGGVAVAYVKTTGEAAALDGDDSVARETTVLGLLAASLAAPAVLPATTDAELWLAPVQGTSLAELAGAGDAAALSVALAATGALLARLHRAAVAPAAPVLRLPWPLLSRLPAHMETARHHTVPTRVIEAARALPDVTAAVRAGWRPTAWTHGDVSPTNTIVGAGGCTRLIDWEGAGVGDPSWDLAGADLLARLVAPGWAAAAAARLRDAYRAAGGPARDPDSAMRCVRMLVAAYQQAVGAFATGTAPDADGSVSRLLAEAGALAAAHRAGAGSVLR